MVRFTMRVEGADVIDAALFGLQVAYADLRPVWPEVSEWMEQKMYQRFESEGVGDGGSGWLPLKSHAYALWKAKHYPSAAGKLLRRTFRLHSSFTDESNSFAGDAIREMNSPNRFIFGSAVPYAAIHHTGGGNLPARKIMYFSTAAQRDLMKIIHRYLIEALKGERLGFNTGVRGIK